MSKNEIRENRRALYRAFIGAAFKAGAGYFAARTRARVAISVMSADDRAVWVDALANGARVTAFNGYFELSARPR